MMERYFPAVAKDAVFCVGCASHDHLLEACPLRTCRLCGASSDEHMLFGCTKPQPVSKPVVSKPAKEAETVEANAAGEAAETAATVPQCQFCLENVTHAATCPLLWRTFVRGPSTKRSAAEISVACYNCGTDEHFGGDCKDNKGGHPWGQKYSLQDDVWNRKYVLQFADLTKTVAFAGPIADAAPDIAAVVDSLPTTMVLPVRETKRQKKAKKAEAAEAAKANQTAQKKGKQPAGKGGNNNNANANANTNTEPEGKGKKRKKGKGKANAEDASGPQNASIKVDGNTTTVQASSAPNTKAETAKEKQAVEQQAVEPKTTIPGQLPLPNPTPIPTVAADATPSTVVVTTDAPVEGPSGEAPGDTQPKGRGKGGGKGKAQSEGDGLDQAQDQAGEDQPQRKTRTRSRGKGKGKGKGKKGEEPKKKRNRRKLLPPEEHAARTALRIQRTQERYRLRDAQASEAAQGGKGGQGGQSNAVAT